MKHFLFFLIVLVMPLGAASSSESPEMEPCIVCKQQEETMVLVKRKGVNYFYCKPCREQEKAKRSQLQDAPTPNILTPVILLQDAPTPKTPISPESVEVAPCCVCQQQEEKMVRVKRGGNVFIYCISCREEEKAAAILQQLENDMAVFEQRSFESITVQGTPESYVGIGIDPLLNYDRTPYDPTNDKALLEEIEEFIVGLQRFLIAPNSN